MMHRYKIMLDTVAKEVCDYEYRLSRKLEEGKMVTDQDKGFLMGLKYCSYLIEIIQSNDKQDPFSFVNGIEPWARKEEDVKSNDK